MNEDRILSMFFEKDRWQYAIEKGLFKDMNKAVMYQLTTPEARLAMYQRIKSGNYKNYEEILRISHRDFKQGSER